MTRGKRKKPPTREVSGERLGVATEKPVEVESVPAPVSPEKPSGDTGFVLPADAGLPVGDGPAATEAAVAALQPEPEPKADPLDGAPKGKPGRPPAGSPPPGQWSRNRIRDAKRAELSRRVIELQDQVSALRPVDAPHALGEPVTAPVDELKETLGYMLPGISAALQYGVAPEFALTEKEQRVISANAVAPLAPHYGAVRMRVPWVPLLLVLGSTGLGKWLAYAERKKTERTRQKVADAIDTLPVVVAERSSNGSVPHQGQDVKPVPSRPFGGPDE